MAEKPLNYQAEINFPGLLRFIGVAEN